MLLGYKCIIVLCQLNGTFAFTKFKKKYSNKQCVGLYTRAEASRGWVMNNTSAKWSVTENCVYLSVELIRDDHGFVFLPFMTGSGNFHHPINKQSDAKLKPSGDLVARVFPRFPALQLFSCYYSGHLLTLVIFKSFGFKCVLWWVSAPEIKMYSR